MNFIIRTCLVILLGLGAPDLFAKEKFEPNKKISAFERIGGTFKVASIKRLDDESFKVVFMAKDGEPKFKKLTLLCNHVHVSVIEGAELRLSADVSEIKGNEAKVQQVVLFLPGRTGETPVWMLSKKSQSKDPPAKLLEMHAPATDYQVF